MRDEIHRMVDSLDESKLKLVYSQLKDDDEKIVGYRADGTPMSLRDLKDRVQRSEEQYEKGQYKTVRQLREESKNWGLESMK